MKNATCIVGYNDKINKILYIGGDSAGVNGLFVRVRTDTKVFKNSNMIFGFTSSFRMGELLQYKLKIPKQKSNQSDYEFMVTDFVDAVKKCLKENEFATIDKGVAEGGTFIVGYKRNLYQIFNDFQVGKTYDNFTTCGCGGQLALGALYAMNEIEPSNKHVSIKERIEIALKTAVKYNGGVRPPFNIISMRYE